MNGPGTLYLLPTLLGTTPAEAVLPHATIERARRIDYVLAENARSARAFLSAIGHPRPIAQIRIVEIGHEPDAGRIDEWLKPVIDGVDAAVVSEAGCPGIADPGATLIARAHAAGIPVKPLVGPSSLLLALMASGLDGQHFRFLGYLPREGGPLAERLREIERQSQGGETQVFIETPYRNERLFEAILDTCRQDTRVSIAVDLTTDDESVVTLHVREWRARLLAQRPALSRRPAVFCLLARAQPAIPPGLRAASTRHAGSGRRAKSSGRQ